MAWIIIAFLILINALYVAAEFAAVAVRRTQIQQLAEQGHRLARHLLPLLNDPRALDRYIAACQIGITISSLVLGAYGQAALTPPLTDVLAGLGGLDSGTAFGWAAAVVLIGLTAIQMILGELVPKSLSLQFPTQMALWTVVPMQWSMRLLTWFIVVLNGSGIALLRLIGMSPGGHHHLHSPEELELLLAESREGGVMKPAEHRRLKRALQLGRRSTREIMVPRTQMQVVDVETPPAELRIVVAGSPYTRLPVVAGSIDEVIGLLHTRDLAVACARSAGGELAVREHLRPILLVPETLPVGELLARFREQGQQAAIVLDEYGGTAGLATIHDVLSELIGRPGLRDGRRPERLPDGRIWLPGDLRFDEVAEWLGEDNGLENGTPDSGSVTVGGRVLEALGHVPNPGERVVMDDLEVEVERVANRAIVGVLVTRKRRQEVTS